jgi:hypothetical protein
MTIVLLTMWTDTLSMIILLFFEVTVDFLNYFGAPFFEKLIVHLILYYHGYTSFRGKNRPIIFSLKFFKLKNLHFVAFHACFYVHVILLPSFRAINKPIIFLNFFLNVRICILWLFMHVR